MAPSRTIQATMTDSSDDETPDVDLLRLIGDQDRRAMHRFYLRHSRAVQAFAWRRLDDADAAQDVVVETMFEVWRCATQFSGQSQVRTWLLGIARHKLLDRIRADGRMQTQELDEELADTLADSTPGPYGLLLAKQRAQALVDCVAVLPDAQKESLHLAFHEDLSLKEIAEIQGVPANTVATRIHHAKRKLAECLARNLGVAWETAA
jgi:RNA polymerase sigma-70 factor (ECF subfamily)